MSIKQLDKVSMKLRKRAYDILLQLMTYFFHSSSYLFMHFSNPLLHFLNLEFLLRDQLPIEYVNSNKCQDHATKSLENDSIFIVFIELKAIHEYLVIFLKCNRISLQLFLQESFQFFCSCIGLCQGENCVEYMDSNARIIVVLILNLRFML